MAVIRFAGWLLLALFFLAACLSLTPFFTVGLILGGIKYAGQLGYFAGQHLLARRFEAPKTVAVLLLALLLPTLASAQTVSYDVGKTYSISRGEWVLGHTIGIEQTLKGLTLSAAQVFDGARKLETDFGVWREVERGRWTLAGGLNYYRYVDAGFDWTWSTGVRFRVR